MENPYEILGISSDASDSEVKTARRKLLFDLHPDRLPKDLPAGAEELIRKRVLEINTAYEQIKDERQRLRVKNAKKTDSQSRERKEDMNSGQSNSTQAGNKSQTSEEHIKQTATEQGNSPGKIIGQVIGALIGISLVSMCRNAINTQPPVQSYADKVEEITSSNIDYCPELKTSIEAGKDSGDDMDLKLVSEMRRSAPEGSTYQTEVKNLISNLKAASNAKRKASEAQIYSVFTKYLPLLCNGELYLAKHQHEDIAGATPETSNESKTLDILASAMCNAMKNNEDMSSVDSRRSVGAIYMGKELDKLPVEEREQIRIEVAKNMENKEWMNKSIVEFVRKCPDVAYKMMED